MGYREAEGGSLESRAGFPCTVIKANNSRFSLWGNQPLCYSGRHPGVGFKRGWGSSGSALTGALKEESYYLFHVCRESKWLCLLEKPSVMMNVCVGSAEAGNSFEIRVSDCSPRPREGYWPHLGLKLLSLTVFSGPWRVMFCLKRAEKMKAVFSLGIRISFSEQ